MAEPIFKWTGGKRRLLSKYEDLGFFPQASQFDTFVDLFFGGGAVTCWVAERYPDKQLIVNDFNTEMVLMLQQMRNNWEEFKGEYERTYNIFLNTPQERRKKLYFDYRKRHIFGYKKFSEVTIAAALLVMMKVNFNGIWLAYKSFDYRYSTAAGKIDYKESIFDLNKVEAFRDVLARATVTNLSFEDVKVPDRSWVFADPPYRDTRKMYADTFDDWQQIKLCKVLNELANRGCLIAESNKEIGDGFWSEHMSSHQINYLDHKYTCGWGDSVNPVTEVLIKNYGEVTQPVTLDEFF